jgi:hypothetical protein
MPLPLSPHPLSEQKVFRGLIIDIVDEKKSEERETIDGKKGAF